jgi:hypothetical protein
MDCPSSLEVVQINHRVGQIGEVHRRAVLSQEPLRENHDGDHSELTETGQHVVQMYRARMDRAPSL